MLEHADMFAVLRGAGLFTVQHTGKTTQSVPITFSSIGKSYIQV